MHFVLVMPSTLRLVCVKVWGCEIGLPVDFIHETQSLISKDDYMYVNFENVKRGTVLFCYSQHIIWFHKTQFE